MKIRPLTLEEITFELFTHAEDRPPDFFSGEEEYREMDENEAREAQQRLDNGDIWAWCCIEVQASITFGQFTFTESAWLGGCSYKDEGEFMRNGYYEGLQVEALDALNLTLQAIADSLNTLEA